MIRLRWRNRRGRLDGSLEILYVIHLRTEDQMVRPDKWWEQRESVVRNLIYKKDINQLIKFQVNMLYLQDHHLQKQNGFLDG